MTFGKIETRVRRDLLNDNEAGQYRWSVASVMSAMNKAAFDIPTHINAWACVGNDGKPIETIKSARISELCDTNPPGGELSSAEIAEVRAISMPLADRYAEAVAFLAAAYLLQTDASDTANAQKAAEYLQKGNEEAMA